MIVGKWLIVGCLAVAAFGAGIVSIQWLSQSEHSPPKKTVDVKGGGSPTQLALGQRLYVQHCASCHGKNLEGEPNWRRRKPDGKLPAPPHDATGHTWHHSDKLLFRIVKFGTASIAPRGYKTDMPGYKDVLSDDEIRAVLAFIKSRWPTDIQRRHKAMSAGQ